MASGVTSSEIAFAVVAIDHMVVVAQESCGRALDHPGACAAHHHPVAGAVGYLVADAAHQLLGSDEEGFRIAHQRRADLAAAAA